MILKLLFKILGWCIGKRLRKRGPSWSNGDRRHSPRTSIHILNDDVLLNVFLVYQLAILGSEEYENGEFKLIHAPKSMKPFANRFRQRWWYKPAHVCRHWRNLILASPAWLNVQLVCTNGVPVADMLAHSPPLPLTICYHEPLYGHEIMREDEKGILLALSHRDRVRHIYYSSWSTDLKNVITAMNDKFPILEQLYIDIPLWVPFIPITFQAPNLRRLILYNIWDRHPPNRLLTLLSSMPQLETLRLVKVILADDPNHNVEPKQIPNVIRVTLTNLRHFEFEGRVAFLEDLFAQISAPSLSISHLSLRYH